MPIFQGRKGQGKVSGSLLLQLGRELAEKCSTTENTSHLFIHPDHARGILRREHVRELLSSFSWYKEDDRTFLWQSMCIIMCILILMRWDDWEHFHTYFFYPLSGFRRPRYTDKDLPITPENFLEQVPETFARAFLSTQYTFAPVFITENSHSRYSTNHRLPILKVVPLQDGEGAQGVVEKVYIERGYLYYANNTSNYNPQVMACKRITAKTAVGKLNFDAEQRTLEQFKLCINDNKNIMQSFASFIHGSEFIILSPWADGRDLSLFLTKPDEILDNYMARSIRFTPANLLTEAYNLARALNFLHCELVTMRGRKLRCAHLDLKPENVLVSFPPDDRANEAPVGRWKISDFGLSKVEEAVTEDRVLPIGRDDQEASMAPGNIARELSFQPPKRGPGAFQPPEVQSTETAKVSTARDVWSFGCILAMVLAFALGGPVEVRNQKQRRIVGGDDYFYRRTNRRSRTPGATPETMLHYVDAELKPPLRRWVEQASQLTEEVHSQWIQYTSSLILALLDVNVITRPGIFLAVQSLDTITESTEGLASHRLWGFDEGPRPPQPQITILPFHGATPAPLFGIENASVGDHEYTPSSSASDTGLRHQTSRRNSKRSSAASSSFFFQLDPSLSFVRLVAPAKCKGSTIEPLGQGAALWAPTDVRLYALTPLQGSPQFWGDRPPKNPTALDPSWVRSIPLSEGSQCRQVQLSGQWVALLVQLGRSGFRIHVYHRHTPQTATYELRSQFNLPLEPESFKISTYGTLAVRYRDYVEIHLQPKGSAPVPLQKSFTAMTFSPNGAYFCLWESEERRKGHTDPICHYFTIWQQNSNGFATIGEPIKFRRPDHDQGKATGEVLLIPFSAYPRFIACDRAQNLILIRADSPDERERAHALPQTDNAIAGFVLPDDENFLLIRGSQHEHQAAEKCSLSFGGGPALQRKSCGNLHKNVYMETDGAAVISRDQIGGPPCLLTLSSSGLLVRKTL